MKANKPSLLDKKKELLKKEKEKLKKEEEEEEEEEDDEEEEEEEDDEEEEIQAKNKTTKQQINKSIPNKDIKSKLIENKNKPTSQITPGVYKSKIISTQKIELNNNQKDIKIKNDKTIKKFSIIYPIILPNNKNSKRRTSICIPNASSRSSSSIYRSKG